MATEPADDRPTWRDLCIHNFPEVERFEDVEELVADGGYGSLRGFGPRESQVYHHLYNELRGPPLSVNCIKEAVAASSTDNSDESIGETLHPGTRKLDDDGFSYWSSTGQEEPDVPESLVYRLSSPLCSVHEVQIRPFQAIFQKGSPIYSASEVRFRLGHAYKHSPNYGTNGSSGLSEYVWTYTSPKFQMKQESTLQSFKLPRPVLCVGGILQVELLGREHCQHSDNKYYIRCRKSATGMTYMCIAHPYSSSGVSIICYVSVVGRPLQDFEIDEDKLCNQTRYILRYWDMNNRIL